MQNDAVAAGGFRGVERFVGGFEEGSGVAIAVGDHRGDAYADRDYVRGWGGSVLDPHRVAGAELLAEVDGAFRRAEEIVRSLDPARLTEARTVGRKRASKAEGRTAAANRRRAWRDGHARRRRRARSRWSWCTVREPYSSTYSIT